MGRNHLDFLDIHIFNHSEMNIFYDPILNVVTPLGTVLTLNEYYLQSLFMSFIR
jgi:hypothetical protein